MDSFASSQVLFYGVSRANSRRGVPRLERSAEMPQVRTLADLDVAVEGWVPSLEVVESLLGNPAGSGVPEGQSVNYTAVSAALNALKQAGDLRLLPAGGRSAVGGQL